jgi:RimJ/RimL family protein N-acetyltransferase
MDYRDLIALMKRSQFSEALKLSIDVFDKSKNAIGKLVPVGDWILDDRDAIELIRSWRQRAMRMYLTQFESTYEKTFGYLRNLSIAQEGRIFFLIYDSDNRFIGHIGISDVNGKSGELDNLMRGVEGGDPRLVYFAEIALLDWCFKHLEIVETDVRVLSYNWLVISLHEEVGYVHKEKIPLKKNVKDGVTFHDIVGESESNVKYGCVKMLLRKEMFYEANSWINCGV